jgi:hypothetical protein
MSMSDVAPPSKRAGRWLIAVAGFVFLVAGVFAYRPLQIAYHRWQMERGRAYSNGEDAGFGAGFLLWTDAVDGITGANMHFEHHLKRLAELGTIRHKVYRLRHVERGPGAEDGSYVFVFAKHVCRLPCLRATSPMPDKPRPMVLEVYNEWPDSAAWDEFVAAHDVPDFRERFMKEAETTSDR